VRLHSLNFVLLTAAAVAGCGPGGPPNLEGFGDVGETETTPGDGDPGDGDPGDGDPGDGDGDPGDGDGDPGDCIEADYGAEPFIYHEADLVPQLPNDHEGMCGPNPGPDYSIAWRAPDSNLYRATLNSDFPSWLTVLRGGCDGWLENCGAFGFPTIVDFQAVAGESYTFVVDSEDAGTSGYFSFTLEPTAVSSECPVGELFGVPESVGGSTFGAENAFDSQCGGEEAPDRAYMFYPPVTGSYRIDTVGSNYDTMLHVFEGWCGGNLLGCNDDMIGTQSEVIVDLFAGGAYTIVVDGWGGSAGDYQLNVDLVGGSANICDEIEVLPSQVPSGGPWPAGFNKGDIFQQCSFVNAERRFRWIAPADGLYQVSQTSGQIFSSIAVLLGGCDIDPMICQPGSDPIVFEAFAGQEIVFVSEWQHDGIPGEINLLIDVVGGQPGCGTELPSQVPVVIAGTTNGAGNDFMGSCGENPVSEVEYWWTAPETGSYLLSLEGSPYDTLLYVREGGCEGPELACNDDTFDGQQIYLWSSLQLDLVAGQTISIFVDGYSSSGPYELSITGL
jgi:hypothetical protein